MALKVYEQSKESMDAMSRHVFQGIGDTLSRKGKEAIRDLYASRLGSRDLMFYRRTADGVEVVTIDEFIRDTVSDPVSIFYRETILVDHSFGLPYASIISSFGGVARRDDLCPMIYTVNVLFNVPGVRPVQIAVSDMDMMKAVHDAMVSAVIASADHETKEGVFKRTMEDVGKQ